MRRSPGLHAAPLYDASNAVPCAVTLVMEFVGESAVRFAARSRFAQNNK
jgi:hypothetical protein